MRRILIATLALLLLSPLALATGTDLPPYPLREDDAGSGRDAGNSPATAVPVLPDRVYRGDIHRNVLTQALLFGDWEDWYSFDAAAPGLLDARLDGLDGCLSLLDAQGAPMASSCVTAYVEEARIVQTLPVAGRYHLRYYGPVDQTYGFSFSLTGIPARPVADPLPTPKDDAGSGHDAGDEPREAVPVQSGVVYQGSGVWPEDQADWYSFSLEVGQHLQVRLAADSDCVYVHRPDGTQAGYTCSQGGVELGAIDLLADQPGAWMLEVPTLMVDVYRFSLGVDAAAPTPLLAAPDEPVAPSQDDAPIQPGAPDEGQAVHLAQTALDACLILLDPSLAQRDLDAYPSTPPAPLGL